MLIELEVVRNCSIWGKKIAVAQEESPLYDGMKNPCFSYVIPVAFKFMGHLETVEMCLVISFLQAIEIRVKIRLFKPKLYGLNWWVVIRHKQNIGEISLK